MSSSIIQSLLQQKQVADLNAVPDKLKLEIYILALREIRDRLRGRKPRDIAQDSLIDYEDALDEISCAFLDLRHKKIGKDYQLDKHVIPEIGIALAHVSYIIQIVENGGKNHDYFKYVIIFRDAIFRICAYFTGNRG